MSDSASEIIAVAGETVSLEFEAEEYFAGSLDIVFTVSALDGGPSDPSRAPVPQVRHKETLSTTRLPPKGDSTRKQSAVKWTVEIPPLPDLPRRLLIITFEATGTAESGRRLRARSRNQLRVPGISVTQHPALQTIMLHEFAKAAGTGFTFDPAPIEQRLQELTIEQRKLLATYDIGSRSGRLVVFVTLEPETDRLMFADQCQPGPTSIHANASFTVFSCRGKGELATLVCYTRNFVVNTANPDTQRLFRGPQGGKSASQWLSPHNTAPPKFLVGSHASTFTDGVVWSRLFTDTGVDVMPGNSIHGMINTVGCWMLFRNYNWPASVRNKLFRVYANLLRTEKPLSQIKSALAAAGYDDFARNPNNADSFDKFLRCDMNYAYNFFFKDIVGIQFFSRDNQFFKRFSNMHNPHGLVFEKTFPRSQLLTDTFLYHDFIQRRKADPGFTASDSLWVDNALGFRTATGFLSDAMWKRNLSSADLAARSWADWYLYKPESYSLAQALQPVVGGVP